MSVPFDPPRLQCEGCEEFFNIGELENSLCPSCLKAVQDDCKHSSTIGEIGNGDFCSDCGKILSVAKPEREYEAEEKESL